MTAIAQPAASSVVDFHGVTIVVLNQPSNPGAEVRWLAKLQNRIVLFGSPSAVQKALLRYESNERADPTVIARLGRIPRRDIAWSSNTLNPQVLKYRLHLDAYERNAVPCLAMARELVFGVRFDSHARLDLVVTAGSRQDASTSIVCLRYLADPTDRIDIRTRLDPGAPIATISIASTPDRYSRWVNMFRHHAGDLLLAAATPN